MKRTMYSMLLSGTLFTFKDFLIWYLEKNNKVDDFVHDLYLYDDGIMTLEQIAFKWNTFVIIVKRLMLEEYEI